MKKIALILAFAMYFISLGCAHSLQIVPAPDNPKQGLIHLGDQTAIVGDRMNIYEKVCESPQATHIWTASQIEQCRYVLRGQAVIQKIDSDHIASVTTENGLDFSSNFIAEQPFAPIPPANSPLSSPTNSPLKSPASVNP
jgi:hypothetical protein